MRKPGSMLRSLDDRIERRLVGAVILVAALILAILLLRLHRKNHPASTDPFPVVVVSVKGDVSNPGVYLLQGSVATAADAVRAAGGFGRRDLEAPPSAASLARYVTNGQTVRVSVKGDGETEVTLESMDGAGLLALGKKIDLNTATEEELRLVPRLKSEMAKAIVERRREGNWRNLEELTEIPGVGQKTIEKWKEYLEVKSPGE